ncbi:MAG: hypothetical protein ACRD2C_01645 [Acidimicrobiales bacterium]
MPRTLSGFDPAALQGTVDEVNRTLDGFDTEDARRGWLQLQVHALLDA